MRRFAQWLFAGQQVPTTPWRVVAWWEIRRIPFNVIVGTYGVACLLAFFWAIGTSGRLQPGEDAVEPLGLLAAPFVINVLYTLGWLVEVPARVADPALSPRFGSMLLKLGLGLGLALITLPAGFWVGVRVLQVLGWRNEEATTPLGARELPNNEMHLTRSATPRRRGPRR